MPRVLNRKLSGVPEGAVYVGRPSKWGNPFVIGKHGTRDQVVAKYRAYLLGNAALMAALPGAARQGPRLLVRPVRLPRRRARPSSQTALTRRRRP